MPPAARDTATIRPWLPYAVVAVLLLPFLDKAYTIDDPVFVWIAERVATAPLDPYGFELNWLGEPQPVYDMMASPPLWSYLLAPVVIWSGAAEGAVHAWVAAWALFATWGFVRFTRSLGLDGSAAALLYVTTPCFVLLAHSTMPDIGAAALMLHGSADLLEGVAGGRRRWLRGGVLLCAACMCRYNAAAAPLGLSLLALSAGPARLPLLAATVTPVALTGAMPLVMARGDTPELGVLGLMAAVTVMAKARHLVAVFTHLGASTIFLPAFVILAQRPRWHGAALCGAAIGALIAWAAGELDPGISRTAVFALSAPVAFALATLVTELAREGRSIDPIDAALALWAAAALAVPVVYVHMASKYLVIASPPLIALLLRRRRKACSEVDPQLARALPALAGAAALVSLAFAIADYRHADAYRRFAERELPEIATHSDSVWFSGHWGWQWYAQRAGGHPLDASVQVSPGDTIVTVRGANPMLDPTTLSGAWRNARTVRAEDAFPLRLMSTAAHAGFYSDDWGLLPAGIGSAPHDVFQVWRRKAPRGPAAARREQTLRAARSPRSPPSPPPE